MPRRKRLKEQRGGRPEDAEPKRWASKDSVGFGSKRTCISEVRTSGHLHFWKNKMSDAACSLEKRYNCFFLQTDHF